MDVRLAIIEHMRRNLCRLCPSPCALQADEAARNVFAAVCPLKRWQSLRADGSGASVVSAGEAIRRGQVRNSAEWGPGMWAELHRWGVAEGSERAAWLADFGRRIPVCPCRGHWREVLAELPPPLRGPGLFAWTVAAHNAVNRLLGKPELAEAEARRLWEGSGVAGGLAAEPGAR